MSANRTDLAPALDNREIEIAAGRLKGYSHYNKFGEHSAIVAGHDIWDGEAAYPFMSAAAPLYISSSDNSDTIEIKVQGLDSDWLFCEGETALVGQAKTLLDCNELIRVNRAFNGNAALFAGTVYIYEDDTVIAGVPQTPAKIKAIINPVYQQTQMAIFSIGFDENGYLWKYTARLLQGNNQNAQVAPYIREFGKIFRSREVLNLDTGGITADENSYVCPEILPPRSDIVMRVVATSAVGSVSAGMQIELEKI